MLIDTNILLRFILQDHTELSTRATDIIAKIKTIVVPGKLVNIVVKG